MKINGVFVSERYNQPSILRFHLIHFIKFMLNTLSQKSDIIQVHFARPTWTVIQFPFSNDLFKRFYIITTFYVIRHQIQNFWAILTEQQLNEGLKKVFIRICLFDMLIFGAILVRVFSFRLAFLHKSIKSLFAAKFDSLKFLPLTSAYEKL